MNLANQSIIKHKVGLLNLAEELHNDSQACRVMGVSRDTFYRVKEAKESGGLEALLHKDRRRPNLKNRVDEAVEQSVLAFALESPAAGQGPGVERAAQEEYPCQPYGCAPSGCGTIFRPFAYGWQRWRTKPRKKACC
jgi:hypothetical protein